MEFGILSKFTNTVFLYLYPLSDLQRQYPPYFFRYSDYLSIPQKTTPIITTVLGYNNLTLGTVDSLGDLNVKYNQTTISFYNVYFEMSENDVIFQVISREIKDSL